MTKRFENVTNAVIRNINKKAKKLKLMTSDLEKMGAFSSCPESHRKKFNDLLIEISISSQSLEQFVSIPNGF